MPDPAISVLEGTQVPLRIMATSDVHATLLDYDYSKDQATERGSLARAAGLIVAARADCANTVLVDNGDFLQGAAIADPDEGTDLSNWENPVVAAMNGLRYDAVGLGNHEFNVPTEVMRTALQQAQFPVICSNLRVRRAQDAAVYRGLWRDQLVLDLTLKDMEGGSHRVQVGVISVLPPQVVQWDGLRIGGRLIADDMVYAARRQVEALHGSGVDIVVALVHSGIADAGAVPSAENAATQIAAIDGVDVVVAGHVHRVFPGPSFGASEEVEPDAGLLHGTPTVMPGVYASHLGQVDLMLTYSDGRWQITERQVAVHALSRGSKVACPEEDPGVIVTTSKAHQRTLARMRRPIGQLVAPVTSYFSMVRDDCASRLVAEAKLAYVRKVLTKSAQQDIPLIASVAPLKCGGRAGPYHYVDVAPGDVSLRVLADMQPYTNHISVVQLKGRDVVEWLEKGCAVYNQLWPNLAAQYLYDRDTPTYNREAIYGLSYAVDLSKPARYALDGSLINPQSRRVIDIRWRGIHIAPNQDFLLVTNDYRGGGGGSFPAIEHSREIPLAPAKVRDALAQHIASTSGRRDGAPETWRLRPLPNTRAVFETGPGAAHYLADAELPMVAQGPGQSGFVKFELNMSKLPH